MSSPLRFPSSDLNDVDMEEGETQADSLPDAPSRQRQPLFLAGTPSPARSARSQAQAAGANGRTNGFAELNQSSPMRNIAARRALGMSTPRRVPDSDGLQMSSPMLSFPSSTPARRQNGNGNGRQAGSDARQGAGMSDQDSEPLDFPSYVPVLSFF